MPKKGKKKSKKSEGGPKPEGEEEEKEEVVKIVPSFGWVEIKMVLCDPPVPDMEFSYINEKMRTNQRIRDVVAKIAGFHGRVDQIQLFDRKPVKNEDPTKPPKLDGVTEYSDPSMSLFEIFKTYGEEDKNECPKFTLYYDFKPYNSTEPVLLALMIKGANFKKTI